MQKVIYTLEVEVEYEDGQMVTDEDKLVDLICEGNYEIVGADRFQDGEWQANVTVKGKTMTCRERMIMPDGKPAIFEYQEQVADATSSKELLARYQGTMQ